MRPRAMMMWIKVAKGDLAPPLGVDAPLINTVLMGAISHLALSSQTTVQYSGLPLRTDEDSKRVEIDIARLLEAACAEG